jgi:ubiquinone/menaquinone biosynthesis C-methylase UbiE
VADRTCSDAKAAAVEQWTADPCASDRVSGEAGSESYIRDLLAVRHDYAAWMADELAYPRTAELDVLDVGCGQGIDLVSYALAGARVTGVDLTPRHVELASAHLRALGFEGNVVQGDAEALPLPDASFDRVSSNGVLHHTPDMLAALREIRRVLRPGGQATVIVYNRRSFHYWLDQVLLVGILKRRLFVTGSMAAVLSEGVEHSSIRARPLVRVYSPGEVKRMLIEVGFVDVSSHVRHFALSDTFVTGWMEGRVRAVENPRVLDRIGRVGGWYVVGRGGRPSEDGRL